jgi:anti-sigma regulatory factor (Ser/Thr protein kinase)
VLIRRTAAHVAARHEAGLRPGGFGIFLARELVDELVYTGRGNEVILIKYLTAGLPACD